MTEKKLLTDEMRKAIKKNLAQTLMDTMFGDGLEEEYIMSGISFKGLDNMTDEELLNEQDEYNDEGDEPWRQNDDE
jgi:hypothetical protein